jgi:hypothetical protein
MMTIDLYTNQEKLQSANFAATVALISTSVSGAGENCRMMPKPTMLLVQKLSPRLN